MSQIRDICDGLAIITRYGEGDNDCHFAAEHDVIFAGWDGLRRKDYEKADRHKLKKLGWFWDSAVDRWSRFV